MFHLAIPLRQRRSIYFGEFLCRTLIGPLGNIDKPDVRGGVRVRRLGPSAPHSVVRASTPFLAEPVRYGVLLVLLKQDAYIQLADSASVKRLKVLSQEFEIRQQQRRDNPAGQVLLRLHDFPRSLGHALHHLGKGRLLAAGSQQPRYEFHALTVRKEQLFPKQQGGVIDQRVSFFLVHLAQHQINKLGEVGNAALVRNGAGGIITA